MNKSQILLQSSAFFIAILTLVPSILRGNKSSLYAAFAIELALVETLMSQYGSHPSRLTGIDFLPLVKLGIQSMLGFVIFADATEYFRQK